MSWGRGGNDDLELQVWQTYWTVGDLANAVEALTKEVADLKRHLAVHKAHIKTLEAGVDKA